MCVNKDEMPWTPEEDAVIRELYPAGGSRAVRAVMSARTKHAVQKRASILRVQYERRPRDLAEVEETPWPLPTHEYTEADIAMRGWREAMPVVGTFAPSLGVVLGEAA